jgi:hypothetical protein
VFEASSDGDGIQSLIIDNLRITNRSCLGQ